MNVYVSQDETGAKCFKFVPIVPTPMDTIFCVISWIWDGAVYTPQVGNVSNLTTKHCLHNTNGNNTAFVCIMKLAALAIHNISIY